MSRQFEVTWEGELAATPEEVWAAFTVHTTGWYWKITYEPWCGGAEVGLTPGGGKVTVWDEPCRFVTRAEEGDEFNELDYRLEPRGSGTLLRFRHRGVFAEDHDRLLDACRKHTAFYYHSLGEYLRHFRGRDAVYVRASAGEVSAAGFPALLRALGVAEGTAVGDRVRLTPAGLEPVEGVVDYATGTFLGVRAADALYRFYADAVVDAHRREWAVVLAATVRVTRDLDAAEEAVQEAYVQALRVWSRSGVPERPGAWLTTVARRSALAAMRRRRTLETKLPLLITDDAPDPGPGTGADAGPIGDDRLRLVFTCCHPALSPEARVALTLRLVCGVPTPDISRAFLVPQATMAARITRAKKKIQAARIPYAVPEARDLPARLDAVLTVIHLLYTAGHTAHSGDSLTRDDLTDRALELGRLLHALLPGSPEAAGLLALMLAHRARRATRVDADGRLLRLHEQDRSRWDRAEIAEADRLVVAALTAAPPGRYALQAAIAALHAQAPTYAETDWAQILLLYDELLRVWPSPVVALNRAVAVGMAHGPEAALADVRELERDSRLSDYLYLHAAKAELLHRLGRDAEAAAAYRAALALGGNAVEQEFLMERLEQQRAVGDIP